ncbi:hypothetical protein EVAR_86859_1 [Eumeta japonica]|uniref:Uncharacterized protein n=1 Tax=Eumeta variegata TaxID=151549 RepID=A0A4C1VUN1_EUMVA|nr:hypothetical protein EVAR_86859_1 [Eumeta japonica]
MQVLVLRLGDGHRLGKLRTRRKVVAEQNLTKSHSVWEVWGKYDARGRGFIRILLKFISVEGRKVKIKKKPHIIRERPVVLVASTHTLLLFPVSFSNNSRGERACEATGEQLLTVIHEHSQYQRKHWCVAGLLGRKWLFDGRGSGPPKLI